MKKLITVSVAALLGFSNVALANTQEFSVTVDVNNNIGNLEMEELSKIKFPTIIVDGSTKEGARCNTSSGTNELCRGYTLNSANRIYGTYRVKGSPYAPVNISLSGPATQHGLTFTPSFHPSDDTLTAASHSLNYLGNVNDIVYGFLELTDLTEVDDSTATVFTFFMTAAYN